ncbi:MAG: nitrate ABC transporter substrate-binding protein [Rhodobiaceae bacterium]|nr:nitrate ABC transporter substrate-binding protein [Rhodobiaceae bacterium]
MKKIYFVIFLIFLSSCSEDEKKENNNELLEITFATDWKAQAEQGGFYQALASGKYLKKGLDVKIIQGSANINIPRLLASNSIDFGMGSNSFIPMNMVANNIPGRAVMAVFQKDPQIIMTHTSNNIESIEDIMDLPIMIADASIGGFWLWLKSKYNFKDNQIRKKTISLAPFLRDTSSIQQGYLTSEPYLFEQVTGEQPKVFLMADYGYPSYGAMILASNTMIKNNPKIVQNFVDASIEGWIDYIYGDPSLGNKLILKENSEMTEDVLLQAIRKIREYNMISNEASLGADIGKMSEEKWRNFFNIMSENGVYNKNLNWRDSYTLDFIEKGN